MTIEELESLDNFDDLVILLTESIEVENEPEISFDEYIDILNSVGDDEVLGNNLAEGTEESCNLLENNYSNKQMSKYMSRRWAKRRKAAIKQLGGHCAKCSATKGLEFHHKDRNKKDLAVAKGSSMSEELFQKELSRCILLCPVHHKEITKKQFSKPKAKKKTVKETLETWRYERQLEEARKGYEEFLAKLDKNK